MIISIQRGIPEIKERLEQKGHKVYFDDEQPHSCDAYIYSWRESSLPPLSSFSDVFTNRAPSFDSISHGNTYSGAVNEINASGKSFEEIERLLIQKNRMDYF